MAAQHQHYVPRLLLRGFLSRDVGRAAKEQVHVLDLIENREFTPPVSKVMGERRFNDFWLDEETLATIEPAAGDLETRVAPLIDRIRGQKRLERTAQEFADLSLLVAFQFVRTKKMRLLPARLDAQIRAHVTKLGLDPAKVEGLIEFDEDALKKEHINLQIESLSEYASIIAKKEFFLMTPPEGRTFYLGDHPVVLRNDETRTMYQGRLGIGAPFIQIYLPLAADVLLCAYDRAVLGQLMMVRDEGLVQVQSDALGKLVNGRISPAQMKEAIDGFLAFSPVTPFIDAIRAGDALPIKAEQVECYNSLQAFQAHRFVVDPDGKFEVARRVIEDRLAADSKDEAS